VKFCRALQWAELLFVGSKNSPHNYGIQLDLMEAFRCLNLAEGAVAAFGKLGVKHIQVCAYTIFFALLCSALSYYLFVLFVVCLFVLLYFCSVLYSLLASPIYFENAAMMIKMNSFSDLRMNE